MKRIRINCELNPVTTFRSDLFLTPIGMVRKNCACNGLKTCLYHHYYEVKEGKVPTDAYSHGTVVDKPRPAYNAKRNGKPVVRSTGSGVGNKPASGVKVGTKRKSV